MRTRPTLLSINSIVLDGGRVPVQGAELRLCIRPPRRFRTAILVGGHLLGLISNRLRSDLRCRLHIVSYWWSFVNCEEYTRR
jgi:hypothetical protein